MTPSLPTLSIASAIMSPIAGSAAEIAATLAISSLRSTSLACVLDRARRPRRRAFSMPRLSAIGLAPAATLRMPVVDHRPGQHRRGRGAVTGDVVRLGGDLLGELGAHVLPRVLELDLLGDRDAVVGDRGRAPLLVEHDVAALGPERDRDGVGQLVDAGLEAAPGLLVELQQSLQPL